MHIVPQQLEGAGHEQPASGVITGWQRPMVQAEPVAHAIPQPPQWALLVAGSTQ
jgi:hypothetical protein